MCKNYIMEMKDFTREMTVLNEPTVEMGWKASIGMA